MVKNRATKRLRLKAAILCMASSIFSSIPDNRYAASGKAELIRNRMSGRGEMEPTHSAKRNKDAAHSDVAR